MKKNKIDKIVGKRDWRSLKTFLTFKLTVCETEEEFLHILSSIHQSVGTKAEMIAKRKKIGMDTKELEELEDE